MSQNEYPRKVTTGRSRNGHWMTAFEVDQPFKQGVLVDRQRPIVAVSRRSGDEIHPWLPNGDLRPFAEGRSRPATDFRATQKAENLLSYELQHAPRVANNTKRKSQCPIVFTE